jgi:arylsulfatase
MARRAIHSLGALALICAGSPSCSKQAGLAAPARRVILITCDTLRADHLGCYGYDRQTSPRIDELAQQCLLFENAWSAAPLTGPSISALLSGRVPDEVGTASRSNTLRMPASVVTLAEVLRAAGVDTAAFVSSSVLLRPPPELGDIGVAQGFAHYDDELRSNEQNRDMRERTAADCTDAVLRWAAQRPQGADRFFLWVHYQDPHGPYTPPEEHRRLFERPHPDERELPLSRDQSGAGGIPDYQAQAGLRRPGEYIDRYDAEIHFFDAELGRLLDGLRARGWLDDALLVVTADHGESLGEGGFWFCHGETLQRELVHVPLLVRPPRASQLAPRREPGVVSYLDFWPSALAALGVAGSPNRGLSWLTPELPAERIALQTLGPASSGRQWVSICDRRWRALVLGPQPPLLFDLRGDPREEHDLAALHPEVVRELREREKELLGLHAAAPQQGVPRESDSRMLRELGYTEGADQDR